MRIFNWLIIAPFVSVARVEKYDSAVILYFEEEGEEAYNGHSDGSVADHSYEYMDMGGAARNEYIQEEDMRSWRQPFVMEEGRLMVNDENLTERVRSYESFNVENERAAEMTDGMTRIVTAEVYEQK
jgi:hypothetical protein